MSHAIRSGLQARASGPNEPSELKPNQFPINEVLRFSLRTRVDRTEADVESYVSHSGVRKQYFRYID